MSAQRHQTKLWEVLDAIKINHDLYFDMFVAAVHVSYSIGPTTEEFTKRVD